MSKLNIESSRIRKQIMFPVTVIRVSCFIYFLFNLLWPFYSPFSLGSNLIYNILSSSFLFYGVMGCTGRVRPVVPLLPFCLVKLVQFCLSYIFTSKKLLLFPFIVSCVLGVVVCILLMIDRDKYHIEVEEE